MQDKAINNALLALRRQIIRENLDGLAEVETLLRLRGVPLRVRAAALRRKCWAIVTISVAYASYIVH